MPAIKKFTDSDYVEFLNFTNARLVDFISKVENDTRQSVSSFINRSKLYEIGYDFLDEINKILEPTACRFSTHTTPCVLIYHLPKDESDFSYATKIDKALERVLKYHSKFTRIGTLVHDNKVIFAYTKQTKLKFVVSLEHQQLRFGFDYT